MATFQEALVNAASSWNATRPGAPNLCASGLKGSISCFTALSHSKHIIRKFWSILPLSQLLSSIFKKKNENLEQRAVLEERQRPFSIISDLQQEFAKKMLEVSNLLKF